MTTYSYETEELEKLRGKTILITGCSTGIGNATAKTAHKHGANVILADWNENGLTELVNELDGNSNNKNSRAVSRKTNVANWDDIIEIFELGFTRFGTIDAVISNAGVNWGETIQKHEFDETTNKLKAPSLDGLNINLIGHIYAVKCSTHYFSKSQSGKGQIIITSSAAAFLDTPPLHMYSIAKAGLLGMMRSMRNDLPKQGVTINVIAPWLTMTPMAPKTLKSIWEGLPHNDPEGVGHALLFPIIRPDLNGKCFFISGNKMIEFEDTISSSRPIWMGKELNASVEEGQRRIHNTRPFG